MPLADVNDVYTDIMTSVFSTCHGASGGGEIGPALGDSGLDEVEIALAIERGGGGMPPAIVTGQNAEDVTAYVASIAG